MMAFSVTFLQSSHYTFGKKEYQISINYGKLCLKPMIPVFTDCKRAKHAAVGYQRDLKIPFDTNISMIYKTL